jgi:hypothetical protein
MNRGRSLPALAVGASLALALTGCLDWDALRAGDLRDAGSEADGARPDAPAQGGLIAAWTFDGTGRVRSVPDVVGRLSGATLGASGDVPESATVALADGAVTFDDGVLALSPAAVGELARAVNAASARGSSFEVWVERAPQTTGGLFVDATSIGLTVSQTAEGTAATLATTGERAELGAPAGSGWQQLVIVHDPVAGTSALFADGNTIAVTRTANAAQPAPTVATDERGSFTLGGNEALWRGKLAFVGVFGRALSLDEIRARHAAGPP